MLESNQAALPGTILEDQPGALETGRTILPMLQQEAAKKAAVEAKKVADKEAAAKEVLGREIKQVAPWDAEEYSLLTTGYRELVSDAFRASDANPNDKDLDPRIPGSRARLAIDKAWDGLQQYQNTSAERFTQYNKSIQDFDPNTMSELDLMETNRYFTAPASSALKGEIEPMQMYGKLDLGTYFLDAAKKIPTDKTASAYPSGAGYLRTSTNEFVPTERVWTNAKTIAAPSATNNAYGHLKVLASNIEKNEPAEFERLNQEAAKNGVTIHEQIAFESLSKNMGKQETAGISTDANYGAGGIKVKQAASEWFVEQMGNIKNGNFEAFNFSKLTGPDGSDAKMLPGGTYETISDKNPEVVKRIIGKIRSQTKLPASVSDQALFNAWNTAGRPTEFGAYVDQNQLNTGSQTVMIGDKAVPVNTRQAAIFTYKDPQGNDMIVTLDEYDVENAVTATGEDTQTITEALGTKSLSGEAKVFTKEEYPNYAYGTMVQSGLNKDLDPAAVNLYSQSRGGTVQGAGWQPIAVEQGGTTVTYPTKPMTADEIAAQRKGGASTQNTKKAD